jgi:HD-GYP domain-containing protein (c-di-GMP phosphodiesterase class II)
MTSDRPYRRRLSSEFAANELRKSSGTQLDANVVEAFLGWMKETGRLVVPVTIRLSRIEEELNVTP